MRRGRMDCFALRSSLPPVSRSAMRKLILHALVLCGIIHVSGNALAAPACSIFSDGSGNFVVTSGCTTLRATQSGTSLLNSATIEEGVSAGNGIRFDVTNESGGLIFRGPSPRPLISAVDLR